MLHVLHTFANNSSVPYLTWFAQRAKREGNVRYSFLVMHKERPAMLDEMRALGYHCHWIKFDQEKRKRGMLLALPQLWWFMMKWRPDVVQGHMFDDTLPALLAALLSGIRTRVATRQDTGYHWKYTPQWVFLDRWNAWVATDLIAISSEGREHLLVNEGIPARKITLAPNGIPIDLPRHKDRAVQDRLRKRFGIEDHHVVIGTVARFIEWKGYRFIVEAAAELVRSMPHLRFIFCGTGDQQPEIRKLVTEAGLDAHVVFAGWVERTETASLMGIFDLLLHAPDHEPFGLVYAEAMMCGTVVVSTRTGAARDGIENDVNGILVDERSGKALADGVRRALSADRRAMGDLAQATARKVFSFDVMWNGHMSVYRKAFPNLEWT